MPNLAQSNIEPMSETFDRLRSLMAPLAGRIVIVRDEPGEFYANTAKADAKGRAVFFCAIRQVDRKVAFHLPGLKTFPELLDGLVAPLASKLEGQSCFNLESVDDEILRELRKLSDRCLAKFTEAGLA